MIADELDITSLINWRNTCRVSYAQAVSSLGRSLLRFMEPLFPKAQTILKILQTFRALLGGEVALAFLLSDHPFIPTAVVIY